MPWTFDNPPPPARNKSADEKRACVAAANAALDRTGDEEEAIRACLGAMNNVDKSDSGAAIVEIKKTSDTLQTFWCEVYVPLVPDSEGDFMRPDEVRKTAWDFLARSQLSGAVDREHDLEDTGSVIVESFVAREGDPDFIEGAWVVGIHIPDEELWAQIEKGEINGISMWGLGIREQRAVKIEIPEVVKGETETAAGHTHTFEVSYADDGTFLGGRTSEVNGHRHDIISGTTTEKADGHSHRFAYVESLGRVVIEEAA